MKNFYEKYYMDAAAVKTYSNERYPMRLLKGKSC